MTANISKLCLHALHVCSHFIVKTVLTFPSCFTEAEKVSNLPPFKGENTDLSLHVEVANSWKTELHQLLENAIYHTMLSFLKITFYFQIIVKICKDGTENSCVLIPQVPLLLN